jgi:hypothetical protein
MKLCPFGSVVRFAYGLQKDPSAVVAAVDTQWTTGQVEGQINRLKTMALRFTPPVASLGGKATVPLFPCASWIK